MTQNEAVLRYMKEYGAITQMEAAQELGCWRLASRICDLKRDGYDIQKDTVRRRNRYGDPVSFARYSLREVR